MSSQKNILLVCANPRGTDTLRLSEEERTLKEAIQLSEHRADLDINVLNAATIDDLRRELLRRQYDIVHFSGHGTRNGLVFEDSEGRLMIPNSSALSELLERRSIKTVLLNACYSLASGSFSSLAIDYTIAMEGAIADKSAIEFSRGFYDALGAGLNVPDAYAEGLSCCKLKNLSLSAILLRKGDSSHQTNSQETTEIATRNRTTGGDSDRRLLLGVAIDTSGSMRSSIRNDQRGNLSRLSAVKDGLARLAGGFGRELKTRTTDRKTADSFRVFVYAFGLRHAKIADLLSVVRATDAIDIRGEVEARKQRHEQEARRRYSGLSGLGAIARSYGFGAAVDDLERSARAGAEAAIRKEITAEMADLLLQKATEIGDTTYTPSELAELLERPGDKEVLAEIEPLIYGDTPMATAADEIRRRFERSPRRENEDRVLLIISDGDPTDGDPLPAIKATKQAGVGIISCYVTDADVSNPKLLLANREDSWPLGARLMFDAASAIDESGPFAKHLLQRGWSIEAGSRMFVQVNHSDVLEEFIQVAGSSLGRHGGELPEGR